jgi:hypothetical protein
MGSQFAGEITMGQIVFEGSLLWIPVVQGGDILSPQGYFGFDWVTIVNLSLFTLVYMLGSMARMTAQVITVWLIWILSCLVSPAHGLEMQFVFILMALAFIIGGHIDYIRTDFFGGVLDFLDPRDKPYNYVTGMISSVLWKYGSFMLIFPLLKFVVIPYIFAFINLLYIYFSAISAELTR